MINFKNHLIRKSVKSDFVKFEGEGNNLITIPYLPNKGFFKNLAHSLINKFINRYNLDLNQNRDDLLYPNSAICRINIEYEEGEFIGTGVMISNQHLLTAAHNVYNLGDARFPKRISVFPGIKNNNKQYLGTEIWVNSNYINANVEKDRNANDIALIKIDGNLAKRYGYLGMRYIKNHYESFLFGFNSQKVMTGQTKSDCNSIHSDEKYYYYKGDFFHGQSGSGIMSVNNERYISGIHIARNQSKNEFIGLKLNPELIAGIINIINLNKIS